MGELAAHRVLILHNRYRTTGGEERCVEHLQEIVERHGGVATTLERESLAISRSSAARGMLRGGLDSAEVERAVREFGATVVHAHNLHPTFGYRALEVARAAGAATILHLHNYRLYCSIGTVFRDGHDCTLCAPNNTRHAVKHRCRGSLAESATYAVGLARGQERTIAACDRMIAPVDQLAENLRTELARELPIAVLPHWLPDSEFAHASQAGEGQYALMAGRVAREKGIFTAIEAAKQSGVRLMIAGLGPELDAARELARRTDAPVEFVGQLEGQALVAARMGAAFALLPSLWREVLPYGAIESLAAGLPLLTSDRGGLPAHTEPALVSAAGDSAALAAQMRSLFDDRAERAAAGQRALDRARAELSMAAAAPRLADIYDAAIKAKNSASR